MELMVSKTLFKSSLSDVFEAMLARAVNPESRDFESISGCSKAELKVLNT